MAGWWSSHPLDLALIRHPSASSAVAISPPPRSRLLLSRRSHLGQFRKTKAISDSNMSWRCVQLINPCKGGGGDFGSLHARGGGDSDPDCPNITSHVWSVSTWLTGRRRFPCFYLSQQQTREFTQLRINDVTMSYGIIFQIKTVNVLFVEHYHLIIISFCSKYVTS